MKWVSQITHASRAVADLVLPRGCAACQTPLSLHDSELCQDCAVLLGAITDNCYCHRCGDDRVSYLLTDGQCTRCRLKQGSLRFDFLVRAGRYQGPLRDLILQFKSRFVLDRFLGRLLQDAILGRVNPDQVDAWVPIPAHWWRRVRVGYQPTELLARAAVRGWKGRVVQAIRVNRYVEPFHRQQGMAATARVRAIRGAFTVAPGCHVEGLRICLIDDVMTTGATLSEARRVLREAGAKSVGAAVLARASKEYSHVPRLDASNTVE